MPPVVALGLVHPVVEDDDRAGVVDQLPPVQYTQVLASVSATVTWNFRLLLAPHHL